MAAIMATLLAVMNFYPAQAVRRLIVSSKETELLERAQRLALTLEGFASLTQDNIVLSVQVLELEKQQRILVTDGFGGVLYDNSKVSPLAGRYALLPDLVAALEGADVFRCRYDEEAFASSAAVPVMKGEKAIGAVYIYDYDTEQADFLSSTRSNIFRISLLLAMLGCAVLGFFIAYFGKRIDRLVGGIRQMSGGDYNSRIHMNGQDELAELAGEFNELAGRLQKTEELRQQFVSNASHELKTPLASIKLLSDSILQTEGISREAVNEFLGDINEEIDRLTRITERLLQLTRLDYSSAAAASRCDLHKLAGKVTDLLRETALQAQVRLENQVPPGLFALFDQDGLYQVVFNLVENGVKYNKPGGVVTVSAQLVERGDRLPRVRLKVADTGIGVAPEETPHIFERFYRVDKARSREKGGAGLGLAIVADWIKTMGGEIQVESQLGQGSVFTVTLPAAAGKEAL